jgi:RNA polymerase sigma-70 factor, ECF subfamily
LTLDPQRPTVEQLIQDWRRGMKARDELIARAEASLIESVHVWIYEVVRRRLGESAALQDVRILVIERLDTFKGNSEGEFRAWVNTIARNKLNDLGNQETAAKRTPKKEERLDQGIGTDGGSGPQLPDPDSTPSQRAIGDEEAERLKRAMSKLSPDHRQVIYLRQWDNYRFEEIGNRMVRSEDAAKKLYQRALEELRRLMNEDAP